MEGMLAMLYLSALSRMGISMMFFWIAFSAIAMLGVSLLFGHDHDVDHDIDHDVDGDADHDADHDADQGSGNMSFFSFKVLLMFVAGFGIGGYFGARADYGVIGSSCWGVVAGFAMAAAGYVFLNALYKSQSSSTIRPKDFIGAGGVVEVTIAQGSIGKVGCKLDDRQESFLARAVNGQAIPINSPVRVVDIAGSMLIVEPVTRG